MRREWIIVLDVPTDSPLYWNDYVEAWTVNVADATIFDNSAKRKYKKPAGGRWLSLPKEE